MGAKNQSISDRQESERMGKKIEESYQPLHFKGLVGGVRTHSEDGSCKDVG